MVGHPAPPPSPRLHPESSLHAAAPPLAPRSAGMGDLAPPLSPPLARPPASNVDCPSPLLALSHRHSASQAVKNALDLFTEVAGVPAIKLEPPVGRATDALSSDFPISDSLN